MKKLFKFFAYLLSIILLLIIILTVVAKLTENKITNIALKKVSENINAPVSIEDVSFNLIRKFPLATIELNNVILGSPESNIKSYLSEKENDTILNIQKLYVSVKSKPLLNGIVDIVKVDIKDAAINYLVDTSGKTNIDFLISTESNQEPDTSESKSIDLTLTDLSLKNITCNYTDKLLKASAKVSIPEINVDAKLDSNNIMASAKGKISLSNCDFNTTNLYLMQRTDIDFNAKYNNDSIEIYKLDIRTDGANFNVIGGILLSDQLKIDASAKGTNLVIDELVKYAPETILDELKLNKIAGKLNFNATVKGSYSDIELPKVDVNLEFQEGNIAMADYPELKNISFKGDLTNGILKNNESTQANFSSFNFETKESKFNLAFSLLDIDHPKYNINADADINIQEFVNFIPDSLLHTIGGDILINLKTKGELPDSIGDDFIDYVLANSTANVKVVDVNSKVDSSLTIQNFSTLISYKPNNLQINNLNISIPEYNLNLIKTSMDGTFKGSINDLSNLKVDLNSYDIQTEQSQFYGKATAENLNKPTFTFTSKIKLNLDELKALLPDTLLNTLSGVIKASIDTKGTLPLDSISDYASNILFNNSMLDFSFENVSVELPEDTLYKIKNLSGHIGLSPEAIEINKLSGIAAGISLGIDSTRIENLYNTVILNKKEKLLVNTRLKLGELNYNIFAPLLVSDTTDVNTSSEKSDDEPMHFTMQLKGVASVQSLTYDSIFIEDISTLFNITDSLYIIDQFKFNAFNGSINSSIRYTIKPDNKSVIETKHSINSMDINKLLTDFNNFEDFYEPAIKAENISGLLSTGSAPLFSRINMIGDSIIQDDIRVTGTFKLEKGGVYDFEPAANLSKFTGIKELDNIQFKTLDTKIFIFKSAIFVPETFIASNALNIGAYGMQSFGEDYEYHLEIKLSDILFGKSKKQRRKEKKAGDDFEDDRGMRELYYSKINGKTKYGFDNESLQRTMKNKIVLQQKMLDFRFNPRLVNFETKVYSEEE